ncbi:peptidoglycan-binding protein [Spirulina subsalsa FACHB-351]|uniref:Peptidoglycan-binding protein n=1 Tax=Spirulina subsalsa FACHB-351 TaxID=234711 RepID=A0ABT3LB57_9CYAN|nr:peptidoglycan-binding protein [Spirulina subsalsa]MCW6038750.1 peptidoglycan-binding protein [Spirulina subsalsa FACHB-351]
MKLEDIIHHNIVIKLSTLRTDTELVKQIQNQLSALNLYPGGSWLDGAYSPQTDEALNNFCKQFPVNYRTGEQFDKLFAEALLNRQSGTIQPPITPPNIPPKNSQQIYQDFLTESSQGNADKPALFYEGIYKSPYKGDIKNYPSYLMRQPDGQNVVSASVVDASFSSYPFVGELPKIDSQGLNFLHSDIKEACACVGSFTESGFQVKWLGRNALHNDEFWSATKIIPLLYVVSEANRKYSRVNIDLCNIRGQDSQGNYKHIPFFDLAQDVISYEQKNASSNALGAMFKRFAPQITLENWLKRMTGNQKLIFRGRYGEAPFIDSPELYDRTNGLLVLSPDPRAPQWESNTISSYDLTRMISMLGWHYYLPQASRLPGAQWHSLECLVRAFGYDSARLMDRGIQQLNLRDKLQSVVILSKLGNGITSIRNRAEAVYVTLVHCIDHSRTPNRLVTFSLAMRGAIQLSPRNANQEAIQLDARMATEVTEVLKRAVEGSLGE